jgi:glycosidase
MTSWPKNPVIYEINTWVWLNELTRQYRRGITLGSVPTEEWDAIASLGVDAVWLMGVWERSPTGVRISMQNQGLLADFQQALPDFSEPDNVGSPYCVRRYVVDKHLGGSEELAVARQMLVKRGIRLILDFVPNHVAPDHPWVLEHPEYFIQGTADDLARAPTEFLRIGRHVFANGRDPYFPPWPDVAQLNAFHPGLRRAAIETVGEIASHSDGMRCDMAMLLLNSVFEKTWGHRAGARPEKEYWEEVIRTVRKRYPDALFIAEAYWDLEWELQQQGFDYCYDKRLYDRLRHENGESVRVHLLADLAYQGKLVRFIENHDEPRAASIFSPGKERAAAITVSTLPGGKLFYEGQFEGRKVKLPVFLRRPAEEPIDPDLQAFYQKLLKTINAAVFRDGQWQLCERSGWPDNPSYLNLVAWGWKKGKERYIIIVNFSDHKSQARVRLPWDELAGKSWCLRDVFTDEVYERDGSEMRHLGLYVDLEGWGFHFLKF